MHIYGETMHRVYRYYLFPVLLLIIDILISDEPDCYSDNVSVIRDNVCPLTISIEL